MAQPWKQVVEASMQAREMTRAQAQRLVKQLVREGQVAEEKAKGYVDELVERSRRRTDDLRTMIQREIRSQLSSLGLATKDDLARLEEKLAKSSGASTAGKRSGGASRSGTSKGSSKAGSTRRSSSSG